MSRSAPISRRTWVVIITSIPFLIGLAIAAPFIAWAILYNLYFLVPEGKWAIYDGMKVDVANNNNCYRLHIEKPYPKNLYVKIDDRVVHISEVTRNDLEKAKFKSTPYILNGLERGGSLARLDQTGRLLELQLAHGPSVSILFSASPDGPFLSLPVSFKEFKAQFGKPKTTEYVYPSRTDPR